MSKYPGLDGEPMPTLYQPIDADGFAPWEGVLDIRGRKEAARYMRRPGLFIRFMSWLARPNSRSVMAKDRWIER